MYLLELINKNDTSSHHFHHPPNRQLSEKAKTFYYHYDHIGTNTIADAISSTPVGFLVKTLQKTFGIGTPDKPLGVCHADELPLLFPWVLWIWDNIIIFEIHLDIFFVGWIFMGLSFLTMTQMTWKWSISWLTFGPILPRLMIRLQKIIAGLPPKATLMSFSKTRKLIRNQTHFEIHVFNFGETWQNEQKNGYALPSKCLKEI